MIYLFMHGLGQTKNDWNEVLRKFNLGEVYNPNIGEFANGNYDYKHIYSNFEKYCDSFPEKLNLCGLSLGGVLSLNYAINKPDRVNSLIIIAVQYKMPKTLLKLQNIIFKILGRKAFNSINISKQDMILLSKSMMNIDFSKELYDLKCKTFIICGEKDFFNKRASLAMSRIIKNSKLFLIKNAKHEINKDKVLEL